jgi:hypothetical protein
VPQRPTSHSTLLCTIERSVYAARLQSRCIAPPTGLDWHGFRLSDTGAGEIVCTGGILYDGRDRPSLHTLPYGATWRSGPYTCRSRRVGLTCTARGHGLFVSRESWRVW